VEKAHLRRLCDTVKDGVEIADIGGDQKTGESLFERRSACIVFENWQFPAKTAAISSEDGADEAQSKD